MAVVNANWPTVIRIQPDGQVAWERRISHMSPDFHLMLENIEVRSDGTFLANGSFAYRTLFESNYSVRIGADGAVLDARIYRPDTSFVYSGYLPALLELEDGSSIGAIAAQGSFGLAEVDAGGIPQWSKEYRTSTDLLGYVGVLATMLDPTGDVYIAAKTYMYQTNYRLMLLRAAADGEPYWTKTYDLGQVLPRQVIRTGNGEFVVVGRGPNASDGFAARMNADGTFSWRREYADLVPRTVQELPDGNLLMSTSDGTADLVETGADGIPLAAWVANEPLLDNRILGLRGDSIYILSTLSVEGVENTPALTIAPDLSQLDCFYTGTSVPGSAAGSVPSITDTLITVSAVMKSWSMNIGQGAGVDEIDIRASLAAGPARPGFQLTMYPWLDNNGGATSGPLTRTLTFDPLLTFVSATPAPSSVSGTMITWTGPDSLGGFNTLNAMATFTVPADAGLIGTTITSTFSAAQDSTEITLANNTSTFTQTITGSYDPNDKLVWPRDMFHIEEDSVLDYTIRFQNTGTDTAFTVVVVDTLPLDLDTRSLVLGAASHPFTYSLTGNGILTFTFSNILLPDSGTNEPMSHGLINFSIKPMLPLSLGQTITNAADIYFDFNAPIHTPDATVIVTDDTGVRPAVASPALALYPVPVRQTLSVALPEGFRPRTASVVGTDGRTLPLVRADLSNNPMNFSTAHLAQGAYVLTLVDPTGKRLSARFTKE